MTGDVAEQRDGEDNKLGNLLEYNIDSDANWKNRFGDVGRCAPKIHAAYFCQKGREAMNEMESKGRCSHALATA